jgi:rhodanese-related sulfurtransferase
VPCVAVTELPDDAVLLDVREHDEWTAGHASAATHIPMGELVERLDELPTDGTLFVVCRSGVRSAHVAAFLNANGWDAVNVDGGMQAWHASGRELVADHPDRFGPRVL